MSITAKPRAASHTKKRQAGHHRRSESYMKAYWPYIPIFVIIIGGLYFNHSLNSGSKVFGAQTNFSQNILLSLTNADRSQSHLNELGLSQQLNQAAQSKANSMATQNYFAHTSPSGQTPWALITTSGFKYISAGENLAFGFNNPAQVMQAWMSSPEHRANILSDSYQAVGFGVSEATNFLGKGPKIIVVAEYARPVGAFPITSQNFSIPPAAGVSRFQILTGERANWIEVGLSFVIGVGLACLFIRHAIYLRRLFKDGEKYIIHHPWIDIAFVLVCTVGLILTHNVGLIN
jgi:uncharacterized protein YkwD